MSFCVESYIKQEFLFDFVLTSLGCYGRQMDVETMCYVDWEVENKWKNKYSNSEYETLEEQTICKSYLTLTCQWLVWGL